MNIVIVSNYLTIHQLPFCKALMAHPDVNLTFISQIKPESFRLNMWGDTEHDAGRFLLKAYESEDSLEESFRKAAEADILFCIGHAPKYLKKRNDLGKPSFVFFETIFKTSSTCLYWKNFVRFGKYRILYGKMRKQTNFLLAGGLPCSCDFRLLNLFNSVQMKWGYFVDPDISVNEITIKEKFESMNPLKIIIVSRFLSWKHVEYALKIATTLKHKNIPFSLTIIGEGKREKRYESYIARHSLSNFVHIKPFMDNATVRAEMKENHFYLFTSDRNEGWGVVLNEAMSAGCVVFASGKAGSTEFLVKDGENGVIFHGYKELQNKVLSSLADPKFLMNMALSATETIKNIWSPDRAANNFLDQAKRIVESKPLKTNLVGPGEILNRG